jgi:hypothetical protein
MPSQLLCQAPVRLDPAPCLPTILCGTIWDRPARRRNHAPHPAALRRAVARVRAGPVAEGETQGRRILLSGAPLTEAQVIRIRDEALVVVAPADVVAATVQQRGYAEVDADNPWESWQALRSADGSPPDR